MTKYKIVTDVTNDLTTEERTELGIIAVSAFASVDNADIEIDDADDFYEKLVICTPLQPMNSWRARLSIRPSPKPTKTPSSSMLPPASISLPAPFNRIAWH